VSVGVSAAVLVAFGSLRRRGARTWLTSLGILIGIAAVVVVVSLGQAAREQVGNQLQSLGSNLIYVFPRAVPKSGARIRDGIPKGLTIRDAEALAKAVPATTLVTVYATTQSLLASQYANELLDVVGADERYLDVRGYALESGRNFSAGEVESKAKLVLLGAKARSRLYGTVDPVGHRVRIGRHDYQVIGVLESKGQSPFGADQDDRVIMPIGSWFARVSRSATKQVHMIIASARDPSLVGQTERDMEAVLRERHRIGPFGENDFTLATQREFQQTQERIQGILSVLLLSVASISLFVGGVGVTNIMLVSVNERRREIGLRMAIGAQPGDIRLQFLIESTCLTLVGGFLGLGLASVVMMALQGPFAGALKVDLTAVVIAIGTSFAVGILSGFWPAHRAASLDPIVALRHE
jgi:putative ABC transport system permease protein